MGLRGSRSPPRLVLSLLERSALAEERAGDLAVGVRCTREQVELDAVSEELHRRLIGRLAEAEDRAAALVAYERMREILARELRIAPSAETRRLVERLREEVPVESGAQRPPSDDPRRYRRCCCGGAGAATSSVARRNSSGSAAASMRQAPASGGWSW